MFYSILIILITSLIIYFSGKKFATASSEIGEYFNLPRSVKGATLDAVASSLPELMIGVFSIVFFKEFSIGVGTIAGSVLFNTLIIPSLAVLVSPVVFRVGREVMARDALFYSISVFVFLSAILYSNEWGFALSIIFIAIYVWYVNMIISQTEKYQKVHKKLLGEKISVVSTMVIAFFNIIVMGVATYYLTHQAILLSQLMGVPAIIIGFSIVAVATSIPDAIIAVVNARQGRTDEVLSHVFGSNIFNILIALGLPLLLASLLIGESVDVVAGGAGIVIGLLVSTVVVIYLIIDDYILSKKNAVIMLSGYLLFLGYIFYTTI
ncbi:hypothetical protein KKC45_03370 [Patescibacteria group bacterium]|nr:hypothetical protein [Patescibacteria group bacterium]